MSVHPQDSTVRKSEACLNSRLAVGPAQVRHNAAGVAGAGPKAAPLPRSDFFDQAPKWEPRGGPLVTSRNNCHPPLLVESERAVWEPLRGYVTACGKGTLALHYPGGRTVYGALMCGSWNCPSCRKRLAAARLDRMRRGMESRATWRRSFVTLTLDPKAFGAVVLGQRRREDGSPVNVVSEPTLAQFRRAAAAMSKAWHALNRRLKAKASRAGVVVGEYCRVVELHRNGWPHYHVVYEHPSWGIEDIRHQVEGWELGRVDLRSVSLDDAIGELAPYLVSSERKSAGSKAYQFAAGALPKGFRLVSSSHSFLGEIEEPTDRPDYSMVLRGHFSGYHRSLQELGADARLLLHAPTDGEHRPPSRTVATGDAALVYFAELTLATGLHLDHIRDNAANILDPATSEPLRARPDGSGPRRAQAPLQGAEAIPN